MTIAFRSVTLVRIQPPAAREVDRYGNAEARKTGGSAAYFDCQVESRQDPDAEREAGWGPAGYAISRRQPARWERADDQCNYGVIKASHTTATGVTAIRTPYGSLLNRADSLKCRIITSRRQKPGRSRHGLVVLLEPRTARRYFSPSSSRVAFFRRSPARKRTSAVPSQPAQTVW